MAPFTATVLLTPIRPYYRRPLYTNIGTLTFNRWAGLGAVATHHAPRGSNKCTADHPPRATASIIKQRYNGGLLP